MNRMLLAPGLICALQTLSVAVFAADDASPPSDANPKSNTPPAGGQDKVEPAASPPGPAPTYTPPAPPRRPPVFAEARPRRRQNYSEVRFVPNDASVRLLMLSGEMPFERVALVHYGWWRPHGYYYGYGVAPVYTPLCQGTCTLRLAPGHYQFALAQPGGPIVPVFGGSLLGGPATLHADYVDRSGLRTAGVVVGVVGVLGGIVMIAESYQDSDECDGYGYCYRHSKVNDPLLVGGIGVLIGSAIVSAVLVTQRDEARISVTPLQVLSAGSPRELGPYATSLRVPQGASVRISF